MCSCSWASCCRDSCSCCRWNSAIRICRWICCFCFSVRSSCWSCWSHTGGPPTPPPPPACPVPVTPGGCWPGGESCCCCWWGSTRRSMGMAAGGRRRGSAELMSTEEGRQRFTQAVSSKKYNQCSETWLSILKQSVKFLHICQKKSICAPLTGHYAQFFKPLKAAGWTSDLLGWEKCYRIALWGLIKHDCAFKKIYSNERLIHFPPLIPCMHVELMLQLQMRPGDISQRLLWPDEATATHKSLSRKPSNHAASSPFNLNK